MPTIVEAFDEDLAWARATLPGMSDYPVPDALPFAGRKLVLHEWTLWSEWEQVLAECHRRLVDGGDFATRFVAVTWAYRIWASRTDPDEEDSNFGPDFDPEEWEIKESCERLTDLVGLRRPDETGDAQESAWELVCRCAIQDWEGARAFLERFVTQTSISPRDARALRGQLGAVIALVIENPDVLHVSLSWWKPRLDSGLMDGPFPSDDGDYEQPSQMAWLRPSMLLGWGLKPDPLPPNEDLRLTIADAAHELAQANSLEKLPAHYRAFLARAFVNSGRRQEGAALYRGIVDEEPWVSLGEATWDLRRGIAEALVAAGDSQRAGALMEDLLREHQDTRLSLRLARLYIESECDHRKAYELLERAVKADPSLGSQPAIDIGLTLGRLGVDALSPQAVRHALGANARFRSLAACCGLSCAASTDSHRRRRRNWSTPRSPSTFPTMGLSMPDRGSHGPLSSLPTRWNASYKCRSLRRFVPRISRRRPHRTKIRSP